MRYADNVIQFGEEDLFHVGGDYFPPQSFFSSMCKTEVWEKELKILGHKKVFIEK